jgi:hypothetical protein
MRIEEARRRIASAQIDVEGDGHDWDLVADDVIKNIAIDFDRETQVEIYRTELGLDLDYEEEADRKYWARVEARIQAPIRAERLEVARQRRAELRHEFKIPEGGRR